MFPMPIAFVAQESGSFSQIERAKSGGFKSVALKNDFATDASVAEYKKHGLFVCEWGAVNEHTILHAGVQGFIPQIETPDQYTGVERAIKAGVGVALPKVLVTTYGGIADIPDSREAAHFLELRTGLDTLLVECYAADDKPGEHVHSDLSRMLGQGEIYGFSEGKLFALVGTYRGEIPADYAGLRERVPNFGIYIIEQTSDAQLDTFAKLVAPPAPAIVDPAQCNRNIDSEAHRWLDQFPNDNKPFSRLRAISRIARSTDQQWVNARNRVISALDSVGA